MIAVTANGADIPRIGYGTYGMTGDVLEYVIVHALRAGYRHIDTAQIYGNESEVGEGWVACAIV